MLKCALAFVLVSLPVFAAKTDVIVIETSGDYRNYSNEDLRRRVWALERAVFQLQQKVFALETQAPTTSDSWLCKTSAMGETFTATGTSRVMAENAVMEKCKASPKSSNGFHCSTAKCEQ